MKAKGRRPLYPGRQLAPIHPMVTGEHLKMIERLQQAWRLPSVSAVIRRSVELAVATELDADAEVPEPAEPESTLEQDLDDAAAHLEYEADE